MTFTAYIQRQKSLIRSRRETILSCARDESVITDCDSTEKLIAELSSLKGLNTAERLKYAQISLIHINSVLS